MGTKLTWSAVFVFAAAAALWSPAGRGDVFEGYALVETFNLPAGATVFDALADGRLVALDMADVYAETAVGSRAFTLVGSLSDADFATGPYGGPAFLRVSPDGARMAVGNNGGESWNNYRVGVFDLEDLSGEWFVADHYAAEWIDDAMLALSAGAQAPTRVTVLDTSSNPLSPVNPAVITNVNGASAGVTIDGSGNLYTGNGFGFGGPSDTGWVVAFAYAAWADALATGTPLDFEADGTLVVDMLSAEALGFDDRGNLHVGGGDLWGGSGDLNYAGLVRNAAVADALAGLGPAEPTDPANVRKFDPNAGGSSAYDVVYNAATGELYLRLGQTVYTYRAPTSPFAAAGIDFSPAPGQFVNESAFNNPAWALGPPVGGGTVNPDNSKLVSLGGFGGSITLAFDHTVMDDPANPYCVDAIVFGNAYWVGWNPNRHLAECGYVEISRDANHNGLADDAWYLIPGSHISDPVGQLDMQTWDDDIPDLTYPPFPVDPGFPYQDWIPPGCSGVWNTQGYRLPSEIFDTWLLVNPHGLDATEEGIYGYADFSPVLMLGDLDGDNVVEDTGLAPAGFYTVPDDPFAVGITPGSGGGDGFDIAWAIDPVTGAPAGLEGFDFIRITNGVNYTMPDLGEISPEIGGVADVAPGLMGDGDWDGELGLGDLTVLADCLVGPDAESGVPECRCRVMDFDADADVDLNDFAFWQNAFAGP